MENQTKSSKTTQISENHLLLFTVAIALMLIAFIAFLFLVHRVWNYTVDDAFITFRYAYNASNGFGLSFNQNPPRAEGYTSILWTLLMVLPHWTDIDVVLFSKFASVALMIGSFCLIAFGVSSGDKRWSTDTRVLGVAFACSLFIAFPFAPVHAISGMETALATFLYSLSAVLFIKIQEAHEYRPLALLLLPVSCFLLGTTRPEANLYSIVLLGIVMFYLPASLRGMFIFFCFIGYLLPGVIYFAWRYAYYGMLFPLPFYIKSNQVRLSGLQPTLSFLRNLSIGFSVPLLISIFTKRGLILLPILLVSTYFLTTEHIMGFGNRYYFPFVPVLSILCGLSISQLTSKLPSSVATWFKWALIFVIPVLAWTGFMGTWRSMQDFSSYAQSLERAHILLGRALSKIEWSPTTVIAIADAGAVPYYSRLETIDTFGLNDPVIALDVRGNRGEYIFSHKPVIVTLISKSEDIFEARLPYENALFQSSIEQGYTNYVTFVFHDRYYLWVMWNPDLEDEYVLGQLLRKASRENHSLYLQQSNSID